MMMIKCFLTSVEVPTPFFKKRKKRSHVIWGVFTRNQTYRNQQLRSCVRSGWQTTELFRAVNSIPLSYYFCCFDVSCLGCDAVTCGLWKSDSSWLLIGHFCNKYTESCFIYMGLNGRTSLFSIRKGFRVRSRQTAQYGIINTTGKYCFVDLIWMVTNQDFKAKLKVKTFLYRIMTEFWS